MDWSDDARIEEEKHEMRMLFDAIDKIVVATSTRVYFCAAQIERVQHFVRSQMLRSLVARKDTALKRWTAMLRGITFDEFWGLRASGQAQYKTAFRAIDKDGSKRITVDN